MDALGSLSHHLDAIACIAEHIHIISIPGVPKLLHHIQEAHIALTVMIHQAWFLRTSVNHIRRGNSLYYLFLFHIVCGGIR